MQIEVSIIIVNWNTKQLLLDCLSSIYGTVRNLKIEVWVVDNASTDSSVEAVRESYPQVNILVNEQNIGFAAANNKALNKVKGAYSLLLNSDTILTDGALEKLHDFMKGMPKAGMACCQLLNLDGSKQNSIANFPSILSLLCNESLLRFLLPGRFPSKYRDYAGPIMVDSCIGACLMVRREAMAEVGLLDEDYFFFMEETDWAMRMRQKGWQSWLVPNAFVYHLQGQSAGDNIKARKMFYSSRDIYFRKWHSGIFLLMRGCIILRLLVNCLLNFCVVVLSAGYAKSHRKRLNTYFQLLVWYVRGCPAT